MGTDIHVCVEKKTSEGWEVVKGENPYYTPDSKHENNKYCYEGWLYNSRNYDLFGMLANIRNGSGFAGCDTGEGFKPISNPKGLPKDISEELKNHFDSAYYHSLSWLTLKELKEYDWSQTTKKRGYIPEEDYEDYKEAGRPVKGYSGGVAGQRIITVTEEEYENLENKEEDKKYYIQVEWEVTYEESAKYFIEEVIPELEEIGPPVRIVFGFDN